MKLHELTGQYLALLELAEDESIDPEVIRNTMEGLDGELEEKADACASIIFQLDGNIEMVDKEIQRLEKKKKAMKYNQRYIKSNLETFMIQVGKKKFKTDLFSFGIQKNAPSLDIIDETKIPEEYFIPQDPKLDRKRLLADIKANPEKAAAYAGLKQTESLRIR